MSTTDERFAAKIQLAVNINNESHVQRIESQLRAADRNLTQLQADYKSQTLVVESTLPSHEIVNIIESTGLKAVITGVGHVGDKTLGSAVAIMHEGNPASGIRGVTRLFQVSMQTCLIDGTLDGLQPKNKYRLAVHEYGDLSDGCESCGDVMQQSSDRNDYSKEAYGYLGTISSDSYGRASYRLVNHRVKVWDTVGRSMVLSKINESSNGYGLFSKLACGVIARSAGLFENVKKICTCDGVTIWDERDVPVAGERRSQKNPNSQL